MYKTEIPDFKEDLCIKRITQNILFSIGHNKYNSTIRCKEVSR